MQGFAEIMRDPWSVALLQMLITYEKYNYETDNVCLYKNLEFKDLDPDKKIERVDLLEDINIGNLNLIGIVNELIR